MMNELRGGWARPIPYGTSEEFSVVLDWASHDDFRAWDLSNSIPVANWPENARMSCTELAGDRRPDDVVPNHLGAMVVSDKCRRTMLAVVGMSACAQFLPVRLDYRQEDLGKYYVVKVLKTLAALDRERSRYDLYTSLDIGRVPAGEIKSIRNLVLLPGLLVTDVPLFRLLEMPDWILFSPTLRNALTAAGVTGFEWWEVGLSSDSGHAE